MPGPVFLEGQLLFGPPNVGGSVAMGTACCPGCLCDDGALQCSHCGICTPGTVSIVFSGVTECGCIDNGSISRDIHSITLNGPYAATQSSACIWEVTPGTAQARIEYRQHSGGTDCSDSPTPANNVQAIHLSLTRNADDWDLIATAEFVGDPVVFQDNTVPEISNDNCHQFPTFVNEKTDTDCAYSSVWAHSGSAVLDPCEQWGL